MYVDFTNPYHRRMMHYESDDQLSLPELIDRGSIDARAAAIVWALIERRASYIISGPTAAEAGAGKTTTMNALLPLYPSGTALVYTVGMFEDFDFLSETTPATTTVLANEVSDHLRIYMWGGVARRFLQLPGRGFAVATSCHADTLADVLAMLQNDIHLTTPEIQEMRLIINIGLDIPMRTAWRTGREPKRRWLTTHFLPPAAPSVAISGPVESLAVSHWQAKTDTFSAPPPDVLAEIATWAGISAQVLGDELERRETCLCDLAAQQADHYTTMLAVERYRQEHGDGLAR